MPSNLVSDWGPQFTSRFWKAFCWLMGASVSLSSGFHPESNGQTERVKQDLARTLRLGFFHPCSLRRSMRSGFLLPSKIDRRVNSVSYRLHLLPSMQIHLTFHVSCL
ncbi:hypothetical protein SRHO_G00075820 [Serrasalmus rhombeus]